MSSTERIEPQKTFHVEEVGVEIPAVSTKPLAKARLLNITTKKTALAYQKRHCQEKNSLLNFIIIANDRNVPLSRGIKTKLKPMK